MASGAAVPSVWSAAVTAWRDAVAALRRMPRLSVTIFILLLLFELGGSTIEFGFVDARHGLSVTGALARILLKAAEAVLLAPFAIAIHRFVLLGETTPRYRLDPGDTRFLRFAFYAVLLAFLRTVPAFAAALLALVWHRLGQLAGLVLDVVAAMVAVRVVILFPALAVDAAAADWPQAIEDSKGHFWHIFFVLLVAALPLIPLGALVAVPVAIQAIRSDGAVYFGMATVLALVGSAVLVMLATTVLVTAASRLYRTLGATLG